MRISQYFGPVGDDDVLEVCPKCDGDGYDNEWDDEICFHCLGTGEVPRLVRVIYHPAQKDREEADLDRVAQPPSSQDGKLHP